MYVLKWKASRDHPDSEGVPMYIGITEQEPKGSKDGYEMRFNGHIQDVMSVFNGNDPAHIVIASRVIEHALR